MMHDTRKISKYLIAGVYLGSLIFLLRPTQNALHHDVVQEPDKLCYLQFTKYFPSALEQNWRAKIKEVATNDGRAWKPGCQMLNDEISKIQELVSAVQAHAKDPSSPKSHLSAHQFRDSCTGELSLVYIEPLVSFLRHPLAICPSTVLSVNVLDKGYLLVPYKNEVTNDKSTKWLFDAGASTYDTGGGGACQSWFVNTYRARGIDFDRIIGWESNKTDPSEQWDTVPADIKRKTSWFNIPVTTGLGDPDNPFTFIKHLTKPEDFVVFKLDISSQAVEMSLVKQLMTDHELLELVDEFYFEHHVSGSPMQWNWWGDLQHSKTEFSTLPESYELFTFLREHGVRAHSWV